MVLLSVTQADYYISFGLWIHHVISILQSFQSFFKKNFIVNLKILNIAKHNIQNYKEQG